MTAPQGRDRITAETTMRKAWKWAEAHLHHFCFAVGLIDSFAERWGQAAFFMAMAVYWLCFDTPRAIVTIHTCDECAEQKRAAAAETPR